MQSQGRPPGFTLIELLVVIAIIVILAALLLPVLTRGKIAAQSAACKSNLHQIGVGLKLYTDESQAYPAWNDHLFWDARLLPSISNNRQVFLCPGMKPMPVWTNNPSQPVVNPSYGYNTSGTGSYGQVPSLGLDTGNSVFSRYLKESQVKAPGDLVAVADAAGGFNGVVRGDGDADDGPTAPRNLLTILLPHHNFGANAVFCDGHVEFAKLRVWLRKNEAAQRRFNNDHDPHPETWPYNP